jgi:hypothetical protein
VESKVGEGSRFTVRIPLIYRENAGAFVKAHEQADIHAAATLAPDLEPGLQSMTVATHA